MGDSDVRLSEMCTSGNQASREKALKWEIQTQRPTSSGCQVHKELHGQQRKETRLVKNEASLNTEGLKKNTEGFYITQMIRITILKHT